MYSITNSPVGKQPIFCGARVIGYVKGDTFYKTIHKQHFLRTPPAIANDISVLDDAERAGATLVRITDQDTRTVYTSSIQQIQALGVRFNRGFGNQKYLPLSYWSINGNPPSAGSPVAPKSQPQSTQPQLF